MKNNKYPKYYKTVIDPNQIDWRWYKVDYPNAEYCTVVRISNGWVGCEYDDAMPASVIGKQDVECTEQEYNLALYTLKKLMK